MALAEVTVMRLYRVLLISFAISACAQPDDRSRAPTGPNYKADGTDVTPACSQAYWDWLNQVYLPLLDRPVAEVSDADLAAAAAKKPPSEDTKYSYGLCWVPWFNKYFYGPALSRLNQAGVTFLDQQSVAFKKYDAFLENV